MTGAVLRKVLARVTLGRMVAPNPAGAKRRATRTRWKSTILTVAAIGLIATGLAWFVYRPWALTWGASAAEVTASMPGDGIVPDPNFNATRAVTIDAPPERIWPWLVQMGYGRAGFYSYDRLDNDGIPSAVAVLPQYQGLRIGDSIPLTAHDHVVVTAMEPNESMLWEYAGGESTTVFTWAWKLTRLDDTRTRLISRLRYRAHSLRARLMLDLFEIVMMRRCLLGIRNRAAAAGG